LEEKDVYQFMEFEPEKKIVFGPQRIREEDFTSIIVPSGSKKREQLG